MRSLVLSRLSQWQDSRAAEAARFVVNGLVATGVHFGALTFGLEVLHIPLAALANFFDSILSPIAAMANFLAALFGITASFIGNRYFVFRGHSESLVAQATRFVGIYLLIACLHAGLLFIITDWLKIDFRIGFVVATAMQMTISYFGNRHLVFAK